MLTPQEIVKELDKHIIGQDNAKKAVAIALRNRWRRMQLPPEIRTEITPKNILMIGPTGVGKTEIARRISSITKSPFLKVEATKFTEVGYVGKDVESIIRDLVEVSLKNLKNEEMKKFEKEAQQKAENQIIDELISSSSRKNIDKELLREFLNKGLLDELKIPSPENKNSPIAQIKTFSSMDPLSIEEFFQSLNESMPIEPQKAEKKLISVKEAKKLALHGFVGFVNIEKGAKVF
jgi:ATP-dependent HslUV protease ATP-binding subunit HslU